MYQKTFDVIVDDSQTLHVESYNRCIDKLMFKIDAKTNCGFWLDINSNEKNEKIDLQTL